MKNLWIPIFHWPFLISNYGFGMESAFWGFNLKRISWKRIEDYLWYMPKNFFTLFRNRNFSDIHILDFKEFKNFLFPRFVSIEKRGLENLQKKWWKNQCLYVHDLILRKILIFGRLIPSSRFLENASKKRTLFLLKRWHSLYFV